MTVKQRPLFRGYNISVQTRVIRKNEDGTRHVLYILEGFFATILSDLWTLHEIKRHYPLSVEIGGSTIIMENARDLESFALGMQVAFELCSL